jgi:apolipoprotein N-acyltransferase
VIPLSPRARAALTGAWARRAGAILAGLAAAFAHPPFGFLPGLLGYAALLWLLDNAGPERRLRSAFFRAWLTGVGYFTASTWWIAEAFYVDAREQAWMAPFAVTFMAAGLALFWGLAGLLYRLLAPDGSLRLLVFAGALAGFEWLRGHVLTGFPWDLPGETWRAGSAPSQLASVVGAYGLTWITLAIVAAPGLGWRTRGAKIALGGAALALAGLYGFGAWRLAHAVTQPEPGAISVRIVQPDTPERASYDDAAFREILARNLALTRAPSAPGAKPPDLVIWSEAGLPDALEDYLAPRTWTAGAIAGALRPGESLITGGYRAAPPPPGVFAPDGAAYYNSLVVLRRDGAGLAVTAVYDKYRLVPFGEYLPLDRYLSPLGVHELVHVGSGFTPGPAPRPITPPGLPPIQPLICYESLFPGFTRDGAKASGIRPRLIVNISDDAWFGVTSGPWQHLNIASYRAIEEGLPMVRATPTGVSAIIDTYGRVLSGKLLNEGAYGKLDAVLPPPLKPTIFESYAGVGFASMLLISLASAVLGRRIARRCATMASR